MTERQKDATLETTPSLISASPDLHPHMRHTGAPVRERLGARSDEAKTLIERLGAGPGVQEYGVETKLPGLGDGLGEHGAADTGSLSVERDRDLPDLPLAPILDQPRVTDNPPVFDGDKMVRLRVVIVPVVVTRDPEWRHQHFPPKLGDLSHARIVGGDPAKLDHISRQSDW